MWLRAAVLDSEGWDFPEEIKKGSIYTRTMLVLEEFAEHLFWILTSRMTCRCQRSFA